METKEHFRGIGMQGRTVASDGEEARRRLHEDNIRHAENKITASEKALAGIAMADQLQLDIGEAVANEA